MESPNIRTGLRGRGLIGALAVLCFASLASAQSSGVLREIYTGLTGSTLPNLTNDSNYPNFPFATEIVTNYFEGPYNYGDHYGDRYRALITPPVTGSYVFWVQGQNAGALFLSSDESPFNKTQIAYNTATAFYRDWYAYPSQQSAGVLLQVGRRYYIEAIHSTGNGNDSFAVGWKLPDGTLEQPIPASRLIPFGLAAVSRPSLTSQPINLTVLENSPATFVLGVSNLDAVTCQWQRTGTNLLGYVGATYTLGSAATNDNGASFRCVISNSFGAITSATAVLTVVADTNRPALASVANLNFNTVQVLFSEPVQVATATSVANYSINNGITISSAAIGASTREIRLTTSTLARGSNYTVTVNNVRDRAAAQNIILANSQLPFTALLKGVYREIYPDISGSLLIDLTNNSAFPNLPSSAELITNVFETPDYSLNNYGQRLRARLLPPVTGTYLFWLSAHDTATLLLGTNDQPASARVIASVSASSLVCAREWDIQTNQRSAVIPLVGGQQYYIEALHKAGLSTEFPPDHLAVRWQLPDGSFEEPIPAARLTPFGMTLPLIIAGPDGASAVEGSPVTFSVTTTNVDPIIYQWQRNGVNISAATNASYTLAAVQMADNGANFRCVLSNTIGTTNSPAATLTVIPDTTRPTLISVANSSSNRVVVYYSEAVDPATATNAANYAIPGITISNSPVLAANGRSVTLTTAPLTFGSNYTITVNRVRDRAATFNVIATNSPFTFAAVEFFLQDIGAPPAASLTYTGNGLNLMAGNGSFGGINDSFNYACEQRRGDFDVKVRVARLDFADTWSIASLMAREDLGTNSRYAAVCSTPSVAGTFFQCRTNPGAIPQISGAFPVHYPYTWLRLARVGGTLFTGYASYDGQIWTKLGSVTLPLSSSIYLGFAVSSQSSGQSVTAQFRDFGDNTNTTIGPPAVSIEPPGPSSRRTSLSFTEIMYHPAARIDGRKLEFIELFNSNPFFADISGYRISGDINFTFAAGTVLPGGGFLVIARSPTDIQAVYGVTNVVGPYTGKFSNKSGTVRLRNRTDAILLEVNYDSKAPWPASADGAGHSLVLARPSCGEDDPRAWGQSDVIGGSPGTMDGIGPEPARSVAINEFLAHTDLPDQDYIELYNHSTMPVNLSGYWLSDDPATNKFRISDGTIIGPTGFVYFTEATLGFSLGAGGETIFLVNSNRTRVIDSVLFEGQENGVATGRCPDGGPAFCRLAARSPGAPNGAVRSANIVINEIMYNPISGDDNDEFVELYNRGTNSVDLTNWRFTDGISFTFPTNFILPVGGYLVVAKNIAQLMGSYTNLNTNNTVGNFTGSLGNGGERIALSMPDTIISTNTLGVVKTNLIHIVVNEVTYGTGGRWGHWSDGGGSSLELIDPHSDNRLPSNWTDSDDTAKSTWTTVTATGMLDNNPEGSGTYNALQAYMMDEGECLVDNVSVTFPSLFGTANLVTNSGFELGMAGWVPQGAMRTSFLESTGYLSAHSLHIVAKERGDTGANRIYTILNGQYNSNITGTITAQVKWLHGCTEMLLRLRGNLLEAPGILPVPRNLGTPGARNSRFATNTGPAITEIVHSPVLPSVNQPIVVTARVQDPDGIASVQLVYRLDPFGGSTTTNMVDNGTSGDAVAGDGIYSATIPGQANDAMLAFYIVATDRFTPAASTRFPNDAPTRECLVHFGDTQPLGSFGTYRFWMTQAALNNWVTHEKFSNEPYDGTVVYNDFRVIYNAASHFAGSPAHTKLYDTPIGTNCDYQILVPEDDLLLGENSLRIQQPGLFGADDTAQDEQIAFWIVGQFGVPTLHRRSVNLFINGVHRGIIYEDTQRPSGGFDAEWFPNSDVGDLYKVAYWYEYSDDTSNHGNTNPSLLPFTTTGGIKKLARYRQNFPKRAVKDSAHNFTNLFKLVDMLNTASTGDAYAQEVFPNLDVREWCLSFAAERIVNNTDLYGARRLKGDVTKPGGQNAFILKPAGDAWRFLCWDLDAAFLGTPVDPLFDFTDPPISNLFQQPFVLRTYWQSLEDAANGPLAPARLNPLAQARYQAYQASGIPASAPDGVLGFLAVRRNYILQVISDVRAEFNITSNGGLDFTNASTLASLSGTAPIQARTITVNGISYPLSWTSITNWTVRLPLTGPTNRFVVQGYDVNGNALSNYSKTIAVYFNGPISRPEESLVINEIMFRPAVSNASFVEIYNRSTNTTFDLWNYRLHGVDFNFSPGDIMGPQSFVVVVKDMAAFQAAYGSNAIIVGEFNGNLDPDGETITLIKQAVATNDIDVVIDKVKYEIVPPWPALPARTNSGVSLQLIDAAQDNGRVSNWDDGSGWHFYSFTGKPNSSSSPKLYLYLDAAGEVYLDDIKLVLGSVAGAGSNSVRNGDFETPLSGNWSFAGSSGANTSVATNTYAHSGGNSLRLIFTKAGSTSTCLNQDLSSSMGSSSSSSNYTVSFWYRPAIDATNGTNLNVRFGSSSSPFSPVLNTAPPLATPGASNFLTDSVTPYPLLWINEVQPNNPSGLQDNTGTSQPWIELFNSGTNAISLDGLSLARSYTNLNQWAFPTGTVIQPGQFRVVFVDGRPQFTSGTNLHTSFRIDSANGSIVLSRGQQILDYINYTNMNPGISFGSYPDGQLFDRQYFFYITPGASNNPAPVPVAINEWMADNTHTLLDPSTGTYDDWFELYNFGLTTVNLSGFFLTDDMGIKNKWRVPDGTVITPRGFLLCWADSDLTATNTTGNALHTNFKLSKSGDKIGLFSPDGIEVDAVAFGIQFSDVSMGRYPDGTSGGAFYFMPTATPRTNNVITNNLYSPVLSAIANYTIDEGTVLIFTNHATDTDVPAQQLAFSLIGDIPDGAGVDPVTGVFTWTPTEMQGPGTYNLTVAVTDSGGPPLSDSKTFTVTVNEVNSPPSIGTIANATIDPDTPLSVIIPAMDNDVPAQTLTCSLLIAPAGAQVDASGFFSWTPNSAQAATTNTVIVTVTDNGTPPLSATQSFVVVVGGVPCTSYKGDVAPRLGGNGAVTISDWVQIGRFAAGLADISNSCEFAKTDCAPKPCGNGSITISDWVQAGRYAAGLDLLVDLTDCPPPSGYSPAALRRAAGFTPAGVLRTLLITNMAVAHGQTNCLPIVLLAQGDENALGFSVNFDTNLLTYVSARLGADAGGATLNKNISQISQGRLGLALALGGGEAFPEGPSSVVEVCFRAAAGTNLISAPVTFGDQPIACEAVDVEANTIAANYQNGTVILTSGDASAFEATTMLEGGQVKLRLIGAPGVWQIQTSTNLLHWEPIATLTNTTGVLEYIGSITNSNSRFYRAVKP